MKSSVSKYLQSRASAIAKQLWQSNRACPGREEHYLQCGCVRWFWAQWPNETLFAVPNGGKRAPRTGADLKAEGTVPGVSDLILMRQNKRYGALAIEMKTPTGRQSKEQKDWQKRAEAGGWKYVVCRSLDDFMREVNNYLADR